jgi:cellobiose phosphorylase
VQNPNHRCKGVPRLVVDGRPVEGNLIPPAAPGSTVQVLAILS